jgi:hypothetical protein
MNAERLLRRIRSHPALYGDLGAAKEAQAARIRDKCKARLAPVWAKRRAKVEAAQSERHLRMWA